MLFLGSNIGNFDPPGADGVPAQRSAPRSAPGDALLLGADLVKPERELLLAYDDPLGVTAAFNRNLLVRINRELGADFDLDAFAHRAVWNAAESRVEMHLVSTRAARAHRGFTARPHVRRRRDDLDRELVQVSEGRDRRHAAARRLQELEQWVDESDGFALTLVDAA